jgi:hypothetical protein
MPSTSSDRHSGKAAGTSPDSHKANRGSKVGHGDNSEANRCGQLSTPGAQISQPGPVQSKQSSVMASSDEDVGVSTHQVSIYVDE